jgi:hypothetical protein
MFTLPDTFRNKELSPATQKIYKSKLNALAKAGYDNVEALLAKKLQVIRAIKALVPGDDAADRQNKRTFLSSIFWVLPESILPKKNPYYAYYQKVLPTAVAGSDAEWVAKKNMK